MAINHNLLNFPFKKGLFLLFLSLFFLGDDFCYGSFLREEELSRDNKSSIGLSFSSLAEEREEVLSPHLKEKNALDVSNILGIEEILKLEETLLEDIPSLSHSTRRSCLIDDPHKEPSPFSFPMDIDPLTLPFVRNMRETSFSYPQAEFSCENLSLYRFYKDAITPVNFNI